MTGILQLRSGLFDEKVDRSVRPPLDNDAVVPSRFESNPPGPSEVAVAEMLWNCGWRLTTHLPAGAGESSKTDERPGKKSQAVLRAQSRNLRRHLVPVDPGCNAPSPDECSIVGRGRN